jgi:hypothetical protein
MLRHIVGSVSNSISLREEDFPVAIKHYSACLCGGIAGTIVGYPFDTIKVRLQTQSNLQHVAQPSYRSAVDVLQKTIAKEGILGLYKGIGSCLFGVAFVSPLIFSVYGEIKLRILQKGDKNAYVPFHHLLCAKVAAGVLSSVLCCPVELVKARMQVMYSSNSSKYRNSLHCASSLVQNFGIRALFAGMGATMLREIPGSIAFFSTFNVLRNFMKPNGEPLSPPQLLLIGSIGGVISTIIVFPADVVKSRLQTQPTYLSNPKYHGTWDCVCQSYKAEGLSVFYSGLKPQIIRAFPASATAMLVLELVLRLWDKILVPTNNLSQNSNNNNRLSAEILFSGDERRRNVKTEKDEILEEKLASQKIPLESEKIPSESQKIGGEKKGLEIRKVSTFPGKL